MGLIEGGFDGKVTVICSKFESCISVDHLGLVEITPRLRVICMF